MNVDGWLDGCTDGWHLTWAHRGRVVCRVQLDSTARRRSAFCLHRSHPRPRSSPSILAFTPVFPQRNYVRVDLESQPKEDANGRLMTDTGTEFMRLLNVQIDAVAAVTQGELLARLVESFGVLFSDFQHIQEGLLTMSVEGMSDDALDLRFEQLCAYVNANSRLYDEAEQAR